MAHTETAANFVSFNWSIRWVAPIVLVLALASLGAQWIDVVVANNRKTSGLPGDVRRIIELSEFFAHGFGVAVVLVVLWTVAPQFRRMIPRIVSCVVLPGSTSQIIKHFILRKRPIFYRSEIVESAGQTWIGVFPDHAIEPSYYSQSFPSAHAATAIGFAIGLSWLFPRGRYVFFVLATMSMVQRVVAGAHWVSDVLAGAAIAVIICYLIFRRGRIDAAFSRLELSAPKTRKVSEFAKELPASNSVTTAA